MPGKDVGLVGIELSKDEIRVVAVRYRGSKPQITAASWCPMPDGGVMHGSVQQPGTVAIALRKLLDAMNIPAGTSAVIGIPSEGTVMRTITVPPAPDSELATIVAGEVEHYRILQTRGSHAYIPLTPPIKQPANTPLSVVIAAAEDNVTRSIGDLASRANLRLVAAEPVEFGQLRSAILGSGDSPSSFTIILADAFTDFAVVSHGQLWFYRRIDYGSKHLTGNLSHVISPSVFGAEEPPPADSAVADHKYIEAMLDSLSSEVRRSVEYLRRDFGEHAQFDKLLLSIDTPDLGDLAPLLTEGVGLPVELLPPCGNVEATSDVAPKMDLAEGQRFTGAFGLAMRDAVTFSASVPRVDLYADERSAVEFQLQRRNLTGSFAISGVALVLGILGYALFGMQVNGVNTQVEQVENRVKLAQSQFVAATAQQRLHVDRLRLLSNDGVPLIALIDFISTSLDSGVGLQNMAIAADDTVTLNAEARDEASMLRTVETMQRVPILQGVMIQSFTAKGEGKEAGLTFTVTAKTLPLSAVNVLPTPPVGGTQ